MKKNKLKFLVIPSIVVFSMLTGCSNNFSNLSDTNKITANSKINLDDKLIVKFKPNVTQTQIKDLHKQIGISSFNTISKELNMTEVKIKNSHDITSLKDKYQKSSLVEYAEKDGKLALFSYTASNVDNTNNMSTKAVTGATPNDSFYSLQWNAKNMEADKAWTITTGSKNVTVAVIDSGVDPDHPDLQDNLLPLIDIINEVGENDTYRVGSTTIDYAGKDGNGHGTHVTGILAAKINNTQGVAGMAGNVQILPIKAANHEGNTSASIITKSILRAIDKGVKVINLSIGGPKSEGTQALRDSVDLAIAKGIVFISATGNESNRITNFVEAVTVPAAYPGVLAVASVTRFDKVPNYSNGGPETEIAAPGGGSGKPGEGEKIYSTWPTYKTFEGYRAGIVGPYTYLSGTSMSCPHVSATAALLLTKYPNLTAQQVRVRILATTTDVDTTGFDNATGFGKLNAYKALTENSHDKNKKTYRKGIRMKIRRKIALLLPILLLSACGDAPTTTTPSTTSTKNATGITTLIKKGALSLIVSDEKTKKPIENATIKVIDGNNKSKEQKTDVDGLSTFKDLPEGDNYRIEVSATDYISKTLSTIDSKLEIKQDGATVINITLGKILSTITGKVVSNTGSAIDSAVVKLNDLTATTDSNGMFSIKTGANISGKITASKIGYSSASSNNINVTDWNKTFDAGSVTLTKSTKNTEVVFDISKTPFGNAEGDNINLLKDLGTLLTKNKFNVNYSDITTLNLDTIDILVLPCPSTEYTTSEVEKMVKFVKAGKKLIVLGEWAGYLGFSYNSTNKILKEANLKISPNILKEISSTNYSFNPEYIVTSNYTDHFITKSLGKTAFYSSASVEVIDGGVAKLDTENTKTIAFSSSASFRVQTYIKGASGLIGVSLLGLGKVVALGDSSIFTNSDSDNDKILNLNEENNSKLALNIFNW